MGVIERVSLRPACGVVSPAKARGVQGSDMKPPRGDAAEDVRERGRSEAIPLSDGRLAIGTGERAVRTESGGIATPRVYVENALLPGVDVKLLA